MPAPFAMPCRGAVLVALLVFRALGPVAGVPGAGRAVLRAGLVDAPVGGGLPACCLLPRLISDRRVACPPASRPRRVLLLVAPLVFRAPEDPAAREARPPHVVRRRASKPARAFRSLRRPPHRRCSPPCRVH